MCPKPQTPNRTVGMLLSAFSALRMPGGWDLRFQISQVSFGLRARGVFVTWTLKFCFGSEGVKQLLDGT